jgi:hypothetical protein
MGRVRDEERPSLPRRIQADLLLSRMAQISLPMILFFVIFFGLLTMRGLYLFAQHIDQQNYEKRRFYLMVAEELDRLDKIQAEGNKPKEPDLVLPSKNWVGRN